MHQGHNSWMHRAQSDTAEKPKCLKLKDRGASLNAGLVAKAFSASKACALGFSTVLRAFYEQPQHSRSSTNWFLLYFPCSVNSSEALRDAALTGRMSMFI